MARESFVWSDGNNYVKPPANVVVEVVVEAETNVKVEVGVGSGTPGKTGVDQKVDLEAVKEELLWKWRWCCSR